MTSECKDKDNSYSVIDGLRKNWAIILFVGSIIVGWSNIVSRLENLETETGDLKSQYKEQVATNKQLSDAVIEIKANFEFIKEKLSKLEN